ncbi:MAG: hypothetical protein KJO36_03480 [Acidimicrobiia bacterium]|nr:hypothetical protein [Acidimicrobiia bacterium]
MGSSNLIRAAVLLVAAIILFAVVKAIIAKAVFLAMAGGAVYLLAKSLSSDKPPPDQKQ